MPLFNQPLQTTEAMEWDKEEFVQNIYAIVRLVPVGRVTTYGAIAKALERARNARLVGWAMNRSPDDVPAHRVVNHSGVLTAREFFGGDSMAMLLREEGVQVTDNKISNFKVVFWDPLLEL